MGFLLNFSISNFRVFKSSRSFELKPLTLFTGCNNSGKSSILKALLLLSENAKVNSLDELNFISERHNLGSFPLSKSFNTKIDDPMSFSVIIKLSEPFPPHLFSFFTKYIQFSFRYVQHKEKGNLFISNIFCIDEQSGLPVPILVIQPYNQKFKSILTFVNIKYFLTKLCNYLDQRRQTDKQFEQPIHLQSKEIEAFDFDFKFNNILINDLAYKTDPLLESISNSLIDSDYLYNKLNKFDKKLVDEFATILNEILLDYLSNVQWDESNWYRSTFLFEDDPVAAVKKAYGLINESSHSQILQRLFDDQLELILSFHQIKDLSFDKAIQEFNSNMTDKNIISGKRLLNNEKIKELINEIKEEPLNGLINKAFQHVYTNYLQKAFTKLFEELAGSFNITSLKSLRSEYQRLYPNSSNVTDFNDMILEMSSIEIDDARKTFLINWIKNFDFGDEIIFKRISGSATQVFLKKGKQIIELSDMGYGVSQMLPILLKLVLKFTLRSDTGFLSNSHFFMIEEPETNLHPKLQSLFADFLADAIRVFDVTFLVETHSEYLIRKLQYLTANGSLTPNESVIYYLNKPDKQNKKGDNQVQLINIMKDGSLSGDFGPGFFDEATNWQWELMRLKNSQNN